MVQFKEVFDFIEKDNALLIVRECVPIQTVVQSLIEEPYTPIEYLSVMDLISKAIEKRQLQSKLGYPDYQTWSNKDISELMALAEISLEWVMVMLSDKICEKMDLDYLECFKYKLSHWLSPTLAVISIDPIVDRTLPF